MDGVNHVESTGEITPSLTFENAIKELTVEAVQAAIRKHFRPKRLVIVTAGDFEKTE